jgi:hypothetical protein
VLGLAAFRLIFEEAEEKNNVHKGNTFWGTPCLQHRFLSYLNKTTESKYKYATTHVIIESIPSGRVYIFQASSDVVSTKQALYPIKLLVNFILSHQLFYFPP